MEPRIELSQVIAERDRTSSDWQIRWVLKNLAADPLQIASARFPHGKFKSGERVFEPPLSLNGNSDVEFELPIRCEEAAGLATENAFAILYVSWFGESWRIFVRLKVVVDNDGTPHATTEMITAQKAGFSGVDS